MIIVYCMFIVVFTVHSQYINEMPVVGLKLSFKTHFFR